MEEAEYSRKYIVNNIKVLNRKAEKDDVYEKKESKYNLRRTINETVKENKKLREGSE